MTFAEIVLQIDPCPKPRMTQSDRWRSRPATDRYWAFKDKIRLLWGDRPLPDQFHVIFYVPMPKSWSKKKMAEMLLSPHRQKPDVDNFLKGFQDALWDDDSAIWDARSTKIWAEEGMIMIYCL